MFLNQGLIFNDLFLIYRSSSEQPPLPQDQNGSSANGANKNPGFKMKIKKGSSKVKKKKNVNKGAAPPPLPPLPDEDPKDKLPKAYMDFSGMLFMYKKRFCFNETSFIPELDLGPLIICP